MTKVDCGNGLILEYDETINVGDLITTYHKGYHILTRIVFRDEKYADSCIKTPLFQYEQVLSNKGKKKSGKSQECDASYCKKITFKMITDQCAQSINDAYALRDALFEFVDKGEPK